MAPSSSRPRRRGSRRRRRSQPSTAVVVMYDSVLTPRPRQLPGKRRWPFPRTAGIWPKRSPLVFLGNLPYTEIKAKPERPELRKDDHAKELQELSISPDGRFGLSFGQTTKSCGCGTWRPGCTSASIRPRSLSFLSPGCRTTEGLLPLPCGAGTEGRVRTHDLAGRCRSAHQAENIENDGRTRLGAILLPDGKRLVWGADHLLVADISNWKTSTLPPPRAPSSRNGLSAMGGCHSGRARELQCLGCRA